MSLYICLDCKTPFDEPDRVKYQGETWNACPACGSPDFEKCWPCKGCGKDMEHSKQLAGYCPECVDEALDNPKLVERYMAFSDVRENFAEFLAEIHWKKEEG